MWWRSHNLNLSTLIAPVPTQSMLFLLRRLQFSIKFAFALTIKQSQGQSLESVCLDLSSPVFSYSQLYVAA
jgi:ATP-dependent exoDNAse (exonuclease V) alpha subunit